MRCFELNEGEVSVIADALKHYTRHLKDIAETTKSREHKKATLGYKRAIDKLTEQFKEGKS